ncbi:hypothetical protein AB0C69_34920 [Actinomadura sp. NPDC048032]|uniref:hypothetical protein n=1 Tax=Actinomadura sp. NPDC048032 TaxID=3155747 RepID=UPI00340BF780
MGRRSKPLDPQNPLHRFASELKSLCDAAGAEGSCQATCKRVGITRTTYYAWRSGRQLPGVDALDLAVRAWGGDTAYWMNRRREVEQELARLADRRHGRREPEPSHLYSAAQPQIESVAKVEPLPDVPNRAASTLFRGKSPAIASRLSEARQVLVILDFDDERSNERSALVLLSLLNLGPDRGWNEVERPIIRITEMMHWMAVHYERSYATNTREVIRRSTLHQFIDRGLVIPNPDDPGRPVNSPRWCYQVSESHYEILRSYGQREFWHKLADHFRSSWGPNQA